MKKRGLFALDSRHDGAIVTIETDDGTKISSTLYHPFWVISGRDLTDRPDCHELPEDENQGLALPGRWVNSHDVQAGDILFDSQNHRRTVVRARQEFHPGGTPVCNLMIEDLHNYAVGAAGILFHNTSWCDDAIKILAKRIKSGQRTIDEILEAGIEGGIDQQSLKALIDKVGAGGITPSPSMLARIDNVLAEVNQAFPRSGFKLTASRGGGQIEHYLEFSGKDATGFIHTHFDISTGDLFINNMKSSKFKTGLGGELFRQVESVIKGTGHEVTTISGSFSRDSVNLRILLSEGLEATPAYKIRVAFGYTQRIQEPTVQNAYTLTMGR